MKKVLTVLSMLLLSYFSNAQSGCPFIDIGPDMTLPCTQPCTTLTANYFNTGSTSTYSVSQITYAPRPFAGNSILIGVDDKWSSVISLPFSFCFFGQSYNQFIIGSNGVISFNTANANGFNSWSITGPAPGNTPNDLSNSIMAPWHDTDPTNQGQIYYQVNGTYPCRTFVISWVNIPYYGGPNSVSTGSCPSATTSTQQIVLYETTNVVDINIQRKEVCAWNSGLAIEGIQNGGVAYTVPGRNATQWAATNDAWRFTPNGPSIVSVAWQLNGTQIGTGNNINICPDSAGLYSATATYQPCPGNQPVVVTDYMFLSTSNLSVNIDSVHNASCGLDNGTVYASYSTTSAVLSYGWDNGVTDTTILHDVAPGTYIFHVDIPGCTRYDTAEIINTGALDVTINDSTFTACNPPGNQGVLCAVPIGGQSPYSYEWSNSQNSSCAAGLTAGNYIVTATDAGGCTATASANVFYNFQLPSLDTPQITNVSCNGGNNGQIILTPVNLQPPISYAWSGGLPNSDTVSGLSAATYNVIATDANGCSATGFYTVSEPPAITVGAPTITQATCASGGSIITNVSGGTPPLFYGWSNGQNGITINNLPAGTYTLTVTDQNLCSVTASYDVTSAPNVISFGTPVIINDSCNGGGTGSITANVNGGTGTISLQWSNGQIATTITNLTEGTYTVTATDAVNCSASASYTITEPTLVVFGSAIIEPTTCNTGGTVIAVASGGTGIVSFEWSNGETGNSISDASAGTYTVTATDQNFCTATATYDVPVGVGAIVISGPVITSPSCNGSSDGGISITVSGGQAALTPTWSTGTSGNSITGLIAGNYSVTVTDTTGCSASAVFNVTEPTVVSASAASDSALCFDAFNGMAHASASGGTPPYSYLWSDSSAQTTQTATALHSGSYIVTVTDNNSCSTTAVAEVGEPTDLIISAEGFQVKCIGDRNGYITVDAAGGTSPYNYSATQDFTNFVFATNDTIKGLATGTYTVVVADDNGCTKTIPVDVPNATPDAFTTTTDSTSCYLSEFTDGAAHITATTFINAPYQFAVDGGAFQSSGDFENLSAGTHTIIAVNRNGCVDSVNVFVPQPLPIVVQVIPDSLVLPLGESGSAQVVSLNVSSVNFVWFPFEGLSCGDCPNPTVTVYQSRDYIVTVSMAENENCYTTATLHVDVEPHKPIFIPNSFSPNGDGNNDLFLIYGEGIKTVDLKIFNRWGELVYETNNAFAGWDGTYKGVLQNPAVFIYTAEITFLDDKKIEREGSITLLR